MGLRDLAQRDMRRFLNDSTRGFGWPITLTDPAGLAAPLTGYSNDIAQAIDPDTGQLVSGRFAGVALVIADVREAGFAQLPRGVADRASKPWLVTFDDIEGNSYTFKVKTADPDRGLGMITCTLESYSV